MTKSLNLLISREKHSFTGNNVPLDGETRIDDALMEAIEPFDFRALMPYDYRYLPGFYADRYDQTPQDLSGRATKRGIDGINQALNSSLKGTYDRFTIKENLSRIDSMEANYALLPVWFLSYKYRNKYYYFAMNGCTGEVCGKLPIDKKKLLGKAALIAALVFAVACLAGYFLF